MGEYDKEKLELYLNVNAAIKSKKFIVFTRRVDCKESKIFDLNIIFSSSNCRIVILHISSFFK